MSQRDDHSSAHQDGDAEHLGHLVRSFQDALRELSRMQEEDHVAPSLDQQRLALGQTLAQTMSDAIDHLYIELEPGLLKLARRWIGSQQFRQIGGTRDFPEAVLTLARGAFSAIIEALPTLTVDTTRNVRNLLLTIARNDLFDQERKVYNHGPRRQAEPDQPLDSGDPDAAMWQPLTVSFSGEMSTSEEQKDTTSTDFEEHILARDRRERIWPIVIEFWHQKLAPEDFWIIRMRWFRDPPIAFKHMALRLGDGWTAAALKERHHRILKRTRQYLKDLGLVDADDKGS